MSPKTFVVSSTNQLHAVIKKAKGGDTIELKSGTYEGINIQDVHFNSAVTITSANPDDPAVLLNKTLIENSSNLIFDGFEMEYTEAQNGFPNSGWNALFYVTESSDITLTNSKIFGHESSATDESRNLYEGLPFGVGVRISESENIVVSRNEITDLFKGIGLDTTDGVSIINNHIHKIRVDGVSGTDYTNTLIQENLFENFTPYRKDPDNPNGATDEHSDMIQYWGSGAKFGVHDLKIADNVFLQDTIGTQSIFGRLNLNSTDDPDEISFTNFEISGNLIYNGQSNGITISDVDGAQVFNNTVLSNELVLDDFRKVPIVSIRYDGPRADDDDFDLNNPEVQASRNVDVFNNVFSHAHEAEVTIRAYSKHVNDREDIMASLNITDENNQWLSTRFAQTGQSYESVFKFSYEPKDGETTISLDKKSADIHGDAGSDYYTNPNALESFFNKLNTSVELSVDQTLDNVTNVAARKAEIQADEKASDVEDVEDKDDEAGSVTSAKSVSKSVTDENVSNDAIDIKNVAELLSSELSPSGSNKGERIRGDDSGNMMSGNSGDDFLTAEAGNDLAYGGDGDDRIYGKDGDDVLLGGRGDDSLHGGANEDMIIAGSGNDTLRGGTSDDILIGGSGSNTSYGGGGYDVIILEGSQDEYEIYMLGNSIRIQKFGSRDVDKISTVEAIYFQGSDALYSIDGKTGQTQFLGRNEYAEVYEVLKEIPTEIYSDEDAAQNDAFAPLIPDGSTEDTSTPLAQEEPVEQITSESDRTLTGTNSKDVLWGTKKSDAIFGLEGNDVIFGGAKGDLLSGGTGHDRIRGDNGHDIVIGGAGADNVAGLAGEDLVLGGSGQDFVSGGPNNDIVVGGLGNDKIFGGSGLDTAVFEGRYQDYSIWTNEKTGKTTVKNKDTGEKDILVGVEQLYFDLNDRLYALSETGETSHMRKMANAEEYASLKDSPWDMYSDELIY